MKFEKTGKFDSHVAEVNLVPFIDLLSVCICFLLLTAVWLQAEVLSTKQGLGTEAEATANSKAVWVELESDTHVIVSTKGLGDDSKKRISFNVLADYAASLRQKHSDLNTALVLPDLHAKYDHLVRVMNELRKAEYINIGISPL